MSEPTARGLALQRFDPANKGHKLICLGAMAAADAFGVGRIRSCREQLELNDIQPFTNTADEDAFYETLLAWGKELPR